MTDWWSEVAAPKAAPVSVDWWDAMTAQPAPTETKDAPSAEMSFIERVNRRINEFGTGAYQGIAGLAGLPRVLMENLSPGVDLLHENVRKKLTPDAPPQERRPSLLPTAKEAEDWIFKTVPRVDPTDSFGRLLNETGRAAGGAPIPGAAPIVIGSGLGAYGAGEAVQGPYQPYAKIAGSLLGAGAGALTAGAVRGTAGEMVARRTQGMTEQEWRAALQREAQAKAAGVPLMGPESLDNPALQRLASDVNASAGGGPTMQAFTAKRPGQVSAAAESMLDLIAKADLPEKVIARLQNAATQTIKSTERARTTASSPFYQQAAADTLPAPVLGQIITRIDQEASLASAEVAKKLGALKESILSRPQYGPVYAEMQLLREKAKAPAIAADVAEKQAAATAGPVLREAVPAMEAANPAFGAGQSIYRRMSPDVTRLQKGDVGRLANPTPGEIEKLGGEIGAQRNVLLNTETARPETIRAAAREIAQSDPGALASWTRLHLENAFTKAAGNIRENASMAGGTTNPLAGVNFVQEIAKNPQQRANLKAIVEESIRVQGGNPATVWKGVENTLETLSRTGRIPGVGSQTAGRLESVAESGRGGVVGTALEAARPVDPLNFIRRWWQDQFQRNNMAELARVFTSPDSVKLLRQMAIERPGSARANLLTVSLIRSAELSEQGQ